ADIARADSTGPRVPVTVRIGPSAAMWPQYRLDWRCPHPRQVAQFQHHPNWMICAARWATNRLAPQVELEAVEPAEDGRRRRPPAGRLGGVGKRLPGPSTARARRGGT